MNVFPPEPRQTFIKVKNALLGVEQIIIFLVDLAKSFDQVIRITADAGIFFVEKRATVDGDIHTLK